jgi:hypothetical protein
MDHPENDYDANHDSFLRKGRHYSMLRGRSTIAHA